MVFWSMVPRQMGWHSEWFCIEAGVRQGGVLSPDFYCIYVDDLVEIVTRAGIGCHLRNMFLSILLYADDMALVSPSLRGLQNLLILTEEYCHEWDICLNAKMSKNMFGKKTSSPVASAGGKKHWLGREMDLPWYHRRLTQTLQLLHWGESEIFL